MPHRTRSRLRLLHLVLLALAGTSWWALRRRRPEPVSAGWSERPVPRPVLARIPERARRTSRRRVAASLAFATLFFAGASFSAVAGDRASELLDPAAEPPVLAEAEAAAAEPAPAEEAPAEPVLLEPTQRAPQPAAQPEPAPAPEPAAEPVAAEPEAAPASELEVPVARKPALPQPAPEPAAARRTAARAPAPAPAARPQPLDPEAEHEHVAATVWLHRELADPTPASLRLAPELALKLRRAARQAGVDWALLLGAVRAEGSRGVPARGATLAETAARLADLGARRDGWDAALRLTGRTAAADRAVALARYYRAVGLASLVQGLLARQEALARLVLADERIDLYAGGREDVEAGRIDVRVLALIRYLAESYGHVTVSSLFSGHRLYSRPGVVSAHVYGQAVDISALDDKPIAGNQKPGGLTERAVRDILLLPAEMLPRQVISLLGLGGPSFPLGDHDDHIHVGY